MALLCVALQVKCGDDINFIFRSELPKLLSQPPIQVERQYLEDYDVLRYGCLQRQYFYCSMKPLWVAYSKCVVLRG